MNDSIYVEKNSKEEKFCIYSVICGRVTKLYEGSDLIEASIILENYRQHRVERFEGAITRVNNQVDKALIRITELKS